EYADAVAPADEVVEDKGVRVLIDPKAILFLIGTEMDYKTDKLAAQFVFNNPNQTSACGCGESVQLKPAAGGGADAHSGPPTISRNCFRFLAWWRCAACSAVQASTQTAPCSAWWPMASSISRPMSAMRRPSSARTSRPSLTKPRMASAA